MNVWDTFCIGKTMTCDLCFVPAGGPVSRIIDSKHSRPSTRITNENAKIWHHFETRIAYITIIIMQEYACLSLVIINR